jgi:hypothetical protein
VSCISFVYGISISRKEGYLSKRSHDDYRGQNIVFRLPFFCDACKFHHGRKYVFLIYFIFLTKTKKILIYKYRWFVIKDSYITYIRPDTYEVRFPMLVDRGFEILTGFSNVGTSHGIKIKNLQRTLFVKCRTKRDCEEWAQHLLHLTEQANDFISTTASRFNSFAPVREKQLAYW